MRVRLGARELHEGEAAAVLGIALEQPLDREQPLLDALGVVEPVDADAEQRVRRQAELARSTSRAASSAGGRRQRPAVRPLDRDRDTAAPACAAAAGRRRRARGRCALRGSDRRCRGSCCSGTACGSRGCCCRAGRRAARSRHGQMPKRSEFGHGMCQNVMIVARGRRVAASRGTSAK